ncbi:SDR family NAD(P)-dependent oxidoreductase, partial [Arthrobacter deserti]|nr:SDR family NAD(P)-dependent oxidoreductase [Arthrobacter deserti]
MASTGLDYTGRKGLVTAGAAGIGQAIASRFQELGADVFVTDVDPEAVARAEESGFPARVSDVSDEQQVADLMATIGAEFGGLDVLVNNAGIAGPIGPIEDLDADDWPRTFDVNVHGQFYAVKHALPMLRRAREGAIVNLSSAAGRLGMAGRSPYSASKWAVVGLTKTLAI